MLYILHATQCQYHVLYDCFTRLGKSLKLIADGSRHILGVCEHDQGGALIEHGLLIESRSYIDKTHILKRTYPPEREKEQYSWMQTFGVFEIFEYYDQLYEWETVPEYEQQIENLVGELL
jgi:hypothetical protein